MYSLSSTELDRVIAYLNGGDDDLTETDIPERLLRITYDLQKKILSEARACKREKAKTEAKLEATIRKTEDAERHKIATGDFANLGLDSLDVAGALAYRIRMAAPHLPFSKGKVILLLYECYAVWLASHKELITVEQPVYTKYGPQFWRVWSKLDKNSISAKQYEALAAAHPGVAKVVERVANKYAEYAEDGLRSYYMKSLPITEIVSEHGKWNTPLSSTSIFQWKTIQGNF